MKHRYTFLLALSLLCIASTASAGELFVVANAGLDISASDVRDAYLGEKQIANGVKLVVIDNLAFQVTFLEQLMHMDLVKYNTVWKKKGFRDGINPPTIAAADLDVLAAVRLQAGAIGYVANIPAAAMGRGIKIVQKISY